MGTVQTLPPLLHRAPGPYAPGRQCTAYNRDGSRCITRLHTCNPGPECCTHEGQAELDRLAVEQEWAPCS